MPGCVLKIFYSAAAAMIFVIFSSTNLYAQQKLFIESNKEEYNLNKYISVLEDKENNLSIYEAASDEMKNAFVFLNSKDPNFGFSNSTFWVKFEVVDTLVNSSQIPWLLISNYPMLEDVELFYRNINSPNEFVETQAGIITPIDNKEIHTPEFIDKLPVQKKFSNIFYLKVTTISPVFLSFRIISSDKYLNNQLNHMLIYGITLGILILLIIYNSLLYFSLRDKTYLFYVLYVFSFTFLLFNYSGLYSQYFGATFTRSYFVLSLMSFAGIGLFWLLLTREFLSTKIYLPSAYKLLNILAAISAVLLVIPIFFQESILIKIFTVTNFIFFFTGIVISLITLKRGNAISKFYLIALSGIIIGWGILTARRSDLIPLSFLAERSLALGVLWETIIIAYTIGYRFNLIKDEKDKEKELIRRQIAADLHDEIGSNLSTISLQSHLMMRNENHDKNSNENLQDIADIAASTMDTIKDIVWFINPFHDNSDEIVLRMKELASKMLINLKYSFDAKTNGKLLFDSIPDLRIRRHVYLIFKEALNNIVKHSQALNVNISLSSTDKNFMMIISDDGKGFIEDDILIGDGLLNLKSRAEQMNADILIDSKIDAGTKIILKIPLNKNYKKE